MTRGVRVQGGHTHGPRAYLEAMRECTAEWARVLKPSGPCSCCSGTSTSVPPGAPSGRSLPRRFTCHSGGGRGRAYASPVARTMPTSWRVTGSRFFEPGGARTWAGGVSEHRLVSRSSCGGPKLTPARAEVTLCGSASFSHGRQVGGKRSGETELGLGGDRIMPRS